MHTRLTRSSRGFSGEASPSGPCLCLPAEPNPLTINGVIPSARPALRLDLVKFHQGGLASRMKSVLFEPLHALWDELADFPADEMEDALRHCLGVLARRVRAGNAYWIGGVRIGERGSADPLQGWRPGVQHYLHPASIDTEVGKAMASRWEHREADPFFALTRRDEGTFRAQI